MAELHPIYHVINESEFASLPDSLKSKVVAELKNSNDTVKNLEVEFERSTAELEQQVFDLQGQLNVSVKHIEDLSTEKESLADRLRKSENDCSSRLLELKKLQTDHESCGAKQGILKRNNDMLSEEKEDLLNVLNSRNEQLKTLTEQVKQCETKIHGLTAKKCDLQLKIDEFESKELSADFKEKRWNQERELLENERTWLKDELNRREQQALDLRQDLSSLHLDHQATQEELANKNRELKMNLEDEAARRQRLEKELTDLSERLREAMQQRETDEEKFEKELSTRSKLAQLYKRSANEAEHKIEELTKAIEALQNLFSETKDSHIALQEHCKSLEEEHAERLKEKDHEIGELKEEVSKANELLHSKTRIPLTDEALYDLSPGAAAASRLMKSGLTLSSIYKDHCRVVEQLALVQREKNQLETCFQDLVEEIRVKAPGLKRIKSDYAEAQEVITNLKNQLAKVDQDQQRMLNERDEYFRKYSYARAEVEKYQRDNTDLSTQVRQLLRAVEDMRANGGLPSPVGDRSFLNRSSSSDSAEDLIVFRNIDELQLQNQRLMSELNTAKAMRDEMVKAAQAEEIQSIQRELKHTLEELASLREHKDKQKEMIEAMARQRDKYKEMLHTQSVTAEILSPPKIGGNQSTPPIAPSGDSRDGSTQRQSSPNGDVSSSGAVALLNKEFEVYRNEHQATEKLLSEKIEKLESVVKELRNKNAKLNSEVEYQEEKFKAMLSNNETYKKEIVQLRDRNERMACVISKHEQNILNLSKELSSQKEAETRARVENGHLLDKNQSLDSAIGRYKAEIEILRRDTIQQRQLMLTLQDLQTRMDRKEAEHTMHHDGNLERLTKEKDGLQKTVQSLTEQHNEYIKSIKTKLVEKENKLDEVQIEIKSLTSELALVKSSAEELAGKNEKLESELKLMSETYNETSIDRLQKEVHQWQSQLNYSQASAADVKKRFEDAELEVARLHAENDRLRELSEALENNMKSFKETENEETTALKQQLEDALKNYGRVQSECEELEQKAKKLEMELTEIKYNDAEKQGSINVQLRTLQDSLADVTQSLEEAQQRERDLKKDLEAQVLQTREFQNKLNLESESHNNVARELTDVQGELRLVKEQIGETEDRARRAENHMETLKRECEQKIQYVEAIGDERQKKIIELQEKNTNLYEELEKFMNQVSYLEKMQQASPRGSEGMEIVKREDSGDSDLLSSMSVENASQVLKYLKEEKRTAQSKLAEVEGENAELKAQFSVMDNQMEKLRAELNDAKRDSEILTETTREKALLLSKLEVMTSLQSSNEALMADRDSWIKRTQSQGDEIDNLKGVIASSEKEKEELKCKCENFSDMMNQANEEIERWKRQHDALMEQRAQFDPEQLHKLQTDLVSLDKELKAEKTSSQNLQKQIEELKTKMTTSEETVVSSSKSIEKLVNEKAQLRMLAQKYREKSTQLEAATEDLKGKMKALTEERSIEKEQLRQEVDALKETVKELGEERESLMNQINQFQQSNLGQSSEGQVQEIEQLKSLLLESATKTTEAMKQNSELREELQRLSTDNEENDYRLKAMKSQFDSVKEKLRKSEQDRSLLSQKMQQRVRTTGIVRPPSVAERQPPVRVPPNVRSQASTVEDSSMQSAAEDSSPSSNNIMMVGITTTTSSEAAFSGAHVPPPQLAASGGLQFSSSTLPQGTVAPVSGVSSASVQQPSSLLPRAIIPPLQSGGGSGGNSGSITRTTVAVQPTTISPGPGAISQSDQRSSSPAPGPSQVVHPMIIAASSGATSAAVTGQYYVATSSVPQAVVSPHIESQDIVSGSADNGGTISSSSSIPNFANDQSAFGGSAQFGNGGLMGGQFGGTGGASGSGVSGNEPSTSSEATAGRKRGHAAAGIVNRNQASKRVCPSSPAEPVAPDQSSSVFQHLSSSSAQQMRSNEFGNLVADITSSNQREEDEGGLMEDSNPDGQDGIGGSEDGDSDDSDVVVILSDDEDEQPRAGNGSAPPAADGQARIQPTFSVEPAVAHSVGNPIPVVAPARPSLQGFHQLQPENDDGLVPRTPIVTSFAQSSEHDAPFVPQASGLFALDSHQQLQQPPTSSSIVPVIMRSEQGGFESGFAAGSSGIPSHHPHLLEVPPTMTGHPPGGFGSATAFGASAFGGDFGAATTGSFGAFGSTSGGAVVDVSSVGNGGGSAALEGSSNEASSVPPSSVGSDGSSAFTDSNSQHLQPVQRGASASFGGMSTAQQPAPQRAVFAVSPRVIVGPGSGATESAEPASSSDEAGPAAEPDDAQLPCGEDLWGDAMAGGDGGGSMEASQSAQVEGTFDEEEFDDSSEATAFQPGLDNDAGDGEGPRVDDEDSNGPTTSDDQQKGGIVRIRRPITFDLDEGASSSSGAPPLLAGPVHPPHHPRGTRQRRRGRGLPITRGLFGNSAPAGPAYGQFRVNRGGPRRM